MFKLIYLIEPYYIFILVIIGFIGNSMSIYLFNFSSMRYEQVNFILSALAVTDNGFLLSLLIVYLKKFGINLFDNFKLACKLTVFFGYVFSFLSTWFVVLFSIERVVVVFFPIERFKYCNLARNKLFVFLLVFFSLLLYSYSLITSDLELHENKFFCITLQEWFNVVNLMAFMDTLITMIIPFLLIFLSNILIVLKLTQIKNPCQTIESSVDIEEEAQFSNGIQNNNYMTIYTQSTYLSMTNYRTSFKRNDSYYSRVGSTRRRFSIVLLRNSDKKRRKKNYSKTTRMLMIVSTSFLILHAPIALCKITTFFKTQDFNETSFDLIFNSTSNFTINIEQSAYFNQDFFEFIERISSYIYYLNFSLNFFLYSFNKSKFNGILLKRFCSKN